MALVNFTLAAASAAAPIISPTSATPLKVDLDDLLYSPEEHQAGYEPQHPGNEPFSAPENINKQRKSKLRKRAGLSYLPPQNQFTHYSRQEGIPQNPYNQLHTQIYQQNSRVDIQIENQRVQEILPPRYDNTGQYVHDPSGDYEYEQKRAQKPGRPPYNPGYAESPYAPATTAAPSPSRKFEGNYNPNVHNVNFVSQPAVMPSPLPQRPRSDGGVKNSSTGSGGSNRQVPDRPPDRPPGFTKVESVGGSDGKTQLHAVLDYDDDYYDDLSGTDGSVPVTPLQGPILLRNGTVPVVPLTAYPTVNNGSFYQIPILWTALSLALGYEIQGQVIKGVPCVKRNFQLYCPTAGNTYPLDKIETFIDENKALIKRMYGSFESPAGSRSRRSPGVPDVHAAAGDSFFRHARQSGNTQLPDAQSVNNTGRVDACESKTEIMTPYWALNSSRKLRAIVNTMHFEQAIHQEVCSKKTTSRCSGDCGCEQKYKWHRLLAYDPGDDCAGIFMDWFLFPSCCVCRCNP